MTPPPIAYNYKGERLELAYEKMQVEYRPMGPNCAITDVATIIKIDEPKQTVTLRDRNGILNISFSEWQWMNCLPLFY